MLTTASFSRLAFYDMPNQSQTGKANKLPGTPGRKSSTTSNPAGRASQPKGKKLPVGGSSVGNKPSYKSNSGSSNKATKVTAKTK